MNFGYQGGITKQFILSVAFLATCVGAVEITALGGGNHQAWVEDGTVWLDGISWHTGALASEGVTFRLTNVTISAETGVIYQYEKYNDMLYYRDEMGEVYDSASVYWKYDNLIVPVFLKGSVDFLSRFNAGLGFGVSIVRPLAGKVWTEDLSYEDELEKSRLDTYLACQVKGEAGVRILPRMWIKAAVTAQYKVADLSQEVFFNKRSLFVSLGLAFKL